MFGVVLLELLFERHDPFPWLGLTGIVPLLTRIPSSCALYSLLGVSSCPLLKSQMISCTRRGASITGYVGCRS